MEYEWSYEIFDDANGNGEKEKVYVIHKILPKQQPMNVYTHTHTLYNDLIIY